MNRSSSAEALILSIRPAGEGHREAQLITPENGLFRAFVYGGSRSKLKSLVSPYHSGRIWLYTDTVRQTVKITDFDVVSFRPSIRENLYKTWAAALCAELVTKTWGGEKGQFAGTFTLVRGFLDGLGRCDETDGRIGLLPFLWRYLSLLGLSPDPEMCVRCAETFPVSTQRNSAGIPAETAPGHTRTRATVQLYYSPYEGAFVCPSCARHEDRQFPVSADARGYLCAVATMTPAEARRIPLSPETAAGVKNLLFLLVRKACGSKLKTLESGSGIL